MRPAKPAGYGPGRSVGRGEVFADVADIGARTHIHFAVFLGEPEASAWRGALPPSGCDGYPAFPYRFTDPNAFVLAHAVPPPCV